MIKGLYEAHLPISDMERSIEFYQNLGLELASRDGDTTFFWVEKGKSWIGLWESDHVNTPYHPSIRHIAFYVDFEDMLKAKSWLDQKGIKVKEEFGISPERQPLILANQTYTHAMIYFLDPDGNSLEMITPLKLDTEEKYTNAKTLQEWLLTTNKTEQAL